MLQPVFQFIGGVITGVATGIYSDRLRNWVERIANKDAPKEQHSDHDLLVSLAENAAAQRGYNTDQRRRDISYSTSLMKPPFYKRVETNGRNKTRILSDVGITVQYEYGGIQAIEANKPTEIRTDTMIGLTPADAADFRYAVITNSDS